MTAVHNQQWNQSLDRFAKRPISPKFQVHPSLLFHFLKMRACIKKYVRPGDYTISVKGKFLTRGLKSATACNGANLTLPIKVVDIDQVRQKNEVDRANEQLRIEAAKRQDLELRLRAEQLKQQEAQLKQREEDNLRQKIQMEERAKIQAELEANKLKEELAKSRAAENKKKVEPAPSQANPVQPTPPIPPKTTGF